MHRHKRQNEIGNPMAIYGVPILKTVWFNKAKRRINDYLYKPYKSEHCEIYRKGMFMKRFENKTQRGDSVMFSLELIFATKSILQG